MCRAYRLRPANCSAASAAQQHRCLNVPLPVRSRIVNHAPSGDKCVEAVSSGWKFRGVTGDPVLKQPIVLCVYRQMHCCKTFGVTAHCTHCQSVYTVRSGRWLDDSKLPIITNLHRQMCCSTIHASNRLCQHHRRLKH